MDCIDAILRAGGIEAVEPFAGVDAFRLTRCLACGVEAHYKLQYTLDKNAVGEKTCRACFYRVMARHGGRGAEITAGYSRADVVERLAKGDWELVDLLGGGRDPVLGRCRFCGHIRAARVADFGFGCTCSRKTRSRHPTDRTPAKAAFATSGSAALRWWDHGANDAGVLATATLRARRIAWWRCPSCDLRFEKKIVDMVERVACPVCEQREAAQWQRERERLSVTAVADIPELLQAWADDADPRTVMVSGSWGSYRFRCPRGHHPRLDPSRFLSGGCPACKAAATRAEPKTLAEFLPEIASQWHPERNDKHTPHTVVWNSKRTAWWRADCCGHEWQATVVSRDKYQRLRCPQCRSILGSLGWQDPGLAAEWSPANPATPWHVRPHGSLAFVPEWICSTDPGHVWKMPLSSRASGAECPQCRPTGKSRVELDYHAAANVIFGAAKSGALVRQEAFTTRKSWTVDILVAAAAGSVAIEYDGAYWHRADAKVLVDTSKSRDLLAAGYWVVRLREDDLPALEIEHPRYREIRVYATAPRPAEVMEAVAVWLADAQTG